MKAGKQKRLEGAGWRVGTVDEFLGLDKQESALVEVKLRLARRLRALRAQRGLSQAAVAKLLRSSQSRVAKMETGDATVSRGPVAPRDRGLIQGHRARDRPGRGVN
jgi:DNA-binding XRE family transcriptional regulator